MDELRRIGMFAWPARPAVGWISRAGLACIALAFLIPAHYPPWATFQSEWSACLGVCLLLLGSIPGSQRQGPMPALALVVAASAAVPALQLLVGQISFVSDGLLPALYALGAAAAVALSAGNTAASRTAWLQALLLALLVAALVSAGMALAQWLQVAANSLWIASVPPGARPFANLGQPNHLATLLLLGLVAAVYEFECRLLKGPTLALTFAWLGIALVATQSRTGLLSLLLLAVWWAVVGRRFRARLQWPAMVVALGAVAALSVAWEPLTRLLMLSHAQPLGDRLAPGPRAAIWLQALDASWRAPWWGYGWNQAASAQLAVAVDHAELKRQWDSAHNVVLDLALAAGWPLTALWLAALAFWLWRRVREAVGVEECAAMAGLIAIGVHAMLEYPLAYAYLLAPAALLAGAAHRPPAGDRPRSVWPRVVLASGLFLMLGWIGVEYLRVEQAHRDIRMSQMPFAKADAEPVEPARVALLDAPVALQKLMLARAAVGLSAGQLDAMQKATWRYPMPPALLRLAVAQALADQPQAAVLTLRQLCAVHPSARCDEGRLAWEALRAQQASLPAFPVN